MGGKDGNYRLEIVLLSGALELLLESGRKRSDVMLIVLRPRPLWIETFRILPNRLLRFDGLGRCRPSLQRECSSSGARRADGCAGASKRCFGLANARPKWQSPSRNRAIWWMPV
jgi:hypothetical protein